MRASTIFTLALFVAPAAHAQVGLDWYGLNPYSNGAVAQGLWRFDVTTGNATSTHITIDTGQDVQGGNGLARDPVSGILYAALKVNGVQGRVLATLCPESGETQFIGSMGANISGITFGSDGTLYGVSGDGANPPETLFTIDPQTGAITVLTPLGNGDDGEAIAFNPDDGLIYHWSGLGQPIMETIDPVTLQVTDIPLSGYPVSEIFGAGYAGAGEFYLTNGQSEIIQVDSTGFAQLSATLVHVVRGIVPVQQVHLIGTNACGPASPNSSGAAAEIVALGSTSVAANDVRLQAVGMSSDEFGYFLASPGLGSGFTPPGSEGVFCLAGGPLLGRFNDLVQNAGACGQFGIRVDLGAVPTAAPPHSIALQPGDTWYFQCWYRDGATNNFTDAIGITFD